MYKNSKHIAPIKLKLWSFSVPRYILILHLTTSNFVSLICQLICELCAKYQHEIQISVGIFGKKFTISENPIFTKLDSFLEFNLVAEITKTLYPMHDYLVL